LERGRIKGGAALCQMAISWAGLARKVNANSALAGLKRSAAHGEFPDKGIAKGCHNGSGEFWQDVAPSRVSC